MVVATENIPLLSHCYIATLDLNVLRLKHRNDIIVYVRVSSANNEFYTNECYVFSRLFVGVLLRAVTMHAFLISIFIVRWLDISFHVSFFYGSATMRKPHRYTIFQV